MKKIAMVIIMMISTLAISAQDVIGSWHGLLKVSGIELRISFNISQNNGVYSSTMDSPDQGAFGIAMTSTEINDNGVKITYAAASIVYNGTVKSNELITGTFTQGGMDIPLDLSRTLPEKEVVKRTQEPVKPYPYYSEEVKVDNKLDSVILAGTLTLPSREGKYPVVILISGSGPQNRDEELLNHKPFLVLSDYLTRNGIGVFRYDDRGTASSTGNYNSATTEDFARDVNAIVEYLMTRKEIDHAHIGLIGHSEGGIIAPMVASKSKDVSFIVMMAGTGIPGNELLLLQQEAILKVSGEKEAQIKEMTTFNKEIFNIILNESNDDSITSQLTAYIKKVSKSNPEWMSSNKLDEESLIQMTVKSIDTPWMKYFIRHNPALVLQKVKCPVLAINGSKDLQVPPKENLAAIKKALDLAGNSKVTIKELPGLNHLFQECTTGNPSEYSQIDQTISPVALEEICGWIKRTVL
ncbi:MAG: alpha/beta hydrolase family protein [Omnitrophica WOR_2 bacterium]|jgi:pimeloyl-ACP methyl ester carboxylesterase